MIPKACTPFSGVKGFAIMPAAVGTGRDSDRRLYVWQFRQFVRGRDEQRDVQRDGHGGLLADGPGGREWRPLPGGEPEPGPRGQEREFKPDDAGSGPDQ
jgi:hypothetical protein